MKKIIIIMMLVSLFVVQMTTVSAKEVKVKSQTLVVAENELVELSAQKKFDNLIVIMKELVKNKLSTDKNKLKLKNITITNFELKEKEGFKIYYQLNK